MELEEEKIASESIYEGKIINVYKDLVKLPNQNTSVREYVRHKGAVCIVAVDECGFVVLERQFRYPYRKVITEIPAGKLDRGEDPEDASKRELLEETGLSAKTWRYLGEYYPTAAYSDEIIYMYAAFDLSFSKPHLDDDEFLTVQKMHIRELTEKILNSEIPDGKTQTAVLKVWNLYYAKDK